MNEQNKLAKNLKLLMKSIKISESELSRLTSVSQPVINRIAKGITNNPNIDTLRPLAKSFNVSIGQLIGDEPLFLSDDPNSKDEPMLGPKWIEVPLINWKMAVNWKDISGTKQEIKKFIRLDTRLSDYAYALEIEDTTMEPTFMKGTYIIVEPDLEPYDRDYVIVLLNKQIKPVFRQVLFDGEKMFLKTINTNFDIIQSVKNSKIIGVAVQSHIKLRSAAWN